MAIDGWSDTTARTVGGSTTTFGFLFGPGAAFSTESARQQTAPGDGTISNLYVTTLGAQPANGSLQIIVRIGGADADADGNALVVTIPAGAPAGTYKAAFSNAVLGAVWLNNAVRFREGQSVVLKLVNNATTSTGGISEVRFVTN